MKGIHMNIQRFALSLTAAVCMAGLPALASTSNSGSQSNSMSTHHMHSRSAFSSSTVRSVQRQLKADGFYHGKIDGISGPKTRAAVRAYQRDNKLATTGRIDSATLRRLGVHARMGQAARSSQRMSQSYGTSANRMNNSSNMGMNNPNTFGNSANRVNSPSANLPKDTIKAAQHELKQSGMYNGAINGNWDSATQTAVRDYQQKANLTVTGELDQPTLKALGVPTGNQSNPGSENPQPQPQQ